MSEEYEGYLSKEGAKNVLDLKQIEAAILKKFESIQEAVEIVNVQIIESGEAATETKCTLDKMAEEYNALYDRVQEIEQKGVKIADDTAEFNLGAEFLKCDQFKDVVEGRTRAARMEVKTAIINATGQNQPLVPADRLSGFHTTPNRILSIRDILPASPTTSNLIEFVRENVYTNNAGPQVAGSPEAFENVTKPESGITFTLATAAVTTLAHFIPASKQVIEDSASLQSFINGRLMYGLKLKEETQLLLGTGSNGELNGIHTQATAYTVQSPQLTNEIDIIREMIKQAHVSEYFPDAILKNPQDWYDIDVRKVGSSDDRYVVGNPREMSVARLWGLPVVITNSLTSGQAVVGNFALGAEIKDRAQALVELSLEDSTNFQKNMVTIRAEERIALCVYRTEAFIKGAV